MKKVLISSLFLLNSLLAAESALEAFKNGEYKKAFELYTLDAKDGNSSALNALSYLYFNGLGIQQNDAKGVELLKKSAEKNNKNAAYDLGMMYLIGDHIQQDKKQAFHYLTQASQDKHSDAEFNLALMYYNGDAIDSNITKSLELLEDAAKRGHKAAISNIGRIYMQDFQFEKAVKWLKVNVKNGDEEAKSLLQEIYNHKPELKQD